MSTQLEERPLEDTASGATPRLVTPVFLLITLATFAYFVAVGALVPTLPLYIEGPLGGTSVSVGLAVGAFALSAVLLRPLAGRISDRRGRRLLIVAGATVVAISVAGYTLGTSLIVLIALRILTGVGEAFFYTGAASAINDLAPEERRGEALSIFSLALFSGLAVGPVLGESVMNAGGFEVAWLVAGLSALAAALLGLRVPDTRTDVAEQERLGRLVHPAALRPGIVLASSVWGLSGFYTFVPLYALSLGLSGSKVVFAVYSVVVIGLRGLGARLPDKLGAMRTARAALIFSMLGLALVALTGNTAGLFAGTAVFAVGQAGAFPALMTLAVRNAPAAERGSVVGTFTAFFDLAFGLGAVSLGAIAALFGYRGVFVVAALVAGAGAMLLTRQTRAARLSV